MRSPLGFLLFTFALGPVDEPAFLMGLLVAVPLVGVALTWSVRGMRRPALLVGSGFPVIGLMIPATLALAGSDPELVVALGSLILYRLALVSVVLVMARPMGRAPDGPQDGPTIEKESQGDATRPAYPGLVLAAALVIPASLPVVWIREDVLWAGTDLGITWVPALLVAVVLILWLALGSGWVVRIGGALGILYIIAFMGFLTLDFGEYIFYVLGLGPWMMLFASSSVFLGDVVRIAGQSLLDQLSRSGGSRDSRPSQRPTAYE